MSGAKLGYPAIGRSRVEASPELGWQGQRLIICRAPSAFAWIRRAFDLLHGSTMTPTGDPGCADTTGLDVVVAQRPATGRARGDEDVVLRAGASARFGQIARSDDSGVLRRSLTAEIALPMHKGEE